MEEGISKDIGGERPTQVEKIDRLVGLLEWKRVDKRGERMRKTYAGRESLQVSRSFRVEESG